MTMNNLTEAERAMTGLKLAIASFDTDPPDSDYQKGYLAALTELLPKPEPDRLTVAARDVVALTAPSRVTSAKINGVEISIVSAIRDIIAREVAAAEPSDEAIERFIGAVSICARKNDYRNMSVTAARAALRGEGA